MAPIKFEKHIKNQLEERRIAPSAAGWERISGQLEIQQGKKKSKRVLWMSIAASFIIGVSLTALFLQDATEIATPMVLTTAVENDALKEDRPEKEAFSMKEAPEIQVAQVGETPQQETPVKKTETMRERSSTSNIKNKVVAAVVLPIEKTEQGQEEIPSRESFVNTPALDKVITQKVDEVMAQVEEQGGVTDQEIEDLLRQAQRDIVSKQLQLVEVATVNANDLLLDVEAEVDPENFRDRIFRTLKTEVGKAIRAVANKDN